jgi:N6-L-threonylcarbamoyladenine synthase
MRAFDPREVGGDGERLLVVAGGVAANQAIRAALKAAAAVAGFAFAAPPLRWCGDNAVMVAWAGLERLRAGAASPLEVAPRPRWPLEAPDMMLPGALPQANCT